MKIVTLIFMTLLLLSGCDNPFEDAKTKAAKLASQEKIAKMRAEALRAKEQAILDTKKSLALIAKDKEIEKKKLEVALQTKKLELEKAKQEAKLAQEKALQEAANDLSFKRYLSAILALIIIIAAFFIFYYFKKRREDKLRAYNDNLEKYFRQKEADARVKIAEKLLDTIATGKLNKEQEDRLVSVFSGDSKQQFYKQLENSESEIVEEAIIEIEAPK